MTTIERYVPPEALKGFVRGLWAAAVAGGAAFFATWGATGEPLMAWIVAGSTAFASLAARTGEGYRDARSPGGGGLTPEEEEVLRRLRDGSLDYVPDPRIGS